MDSATAATLLELNRQFYDRLGDQFSATRQRLQPGVRRILEGIQNDQSVLDIGCGNGNFLHELLRRGHTALLAGMDFSPSLLQVAHVLPGISFYQANLSNLSSIVDQLTIPGGWSRITLFATLHHIPSISLRLEILRNVRKLLKPDGVFVLSNWQFLSSQKLKARIQPWSCLGISEDQVDQGDYLLDWRAGGHAFRYLHHFTADELSKLAAESSMCLQDSFLSDGESGNLGLYQVWLPA